MSRKRAASDIDAIRPEVKADLKVGTEDNEDEVLDDKDLNGYLMYPKVFMDCRARHRSYGPLRTLPLWRSARIRDEPRVFATAAALVWS